MKKKILIAIPLFLLAVLVTRIVIVYFNQKAEFDYHINIPKTIELRSNDFSQNGLMPIECTGKGKDVSPSLFWRNCPAGTRSLVLLVTDYDAPSRYFKMATIDHWVVYNIPSTMDSLPKAATGKLLKKYGIGLGANITGGVEYIGPNPPIGQHSYYFRIYALSQSNLNLVNTDKSTVMEAMKGNILAYGELIGKY